MATQPRLPPELSEQVIACIGHDRATALACSTVCRAFRGLSQRLLFHHLAVFSTRYREDRVRIDSSTFIDALGTGTPMCLERFQDFALDATQLHEHVRELSLLLSWSTLPDSQTQRALHALSILQTRGLSSIRMEGVEWTDMPVELQHRAARLFHSVERVDLINMWFTTPTAVSTLFAPMRSLRYIRLSDVEILFDESLQQLPLLALDIADACTLHASGGTSLELVGYLARAMPQMADGMIDRTVIRDEMDLIELGDMPPSFLRTLACLHVLLDISNHDSSWLFTRMPALITNCAALSVLGIEIIGLTLSAMSHVERLGSLLDACQPSCSVFIQLHASFGRASPSLAGTGQALHDWERHRGERGVIKRLTVFASGYVPESILSSLSMLKTRYKVAVNVVEQQ